jgi:peroxiredoxin
VAISPQVNPFLQYSVGKNGVTFEMLGDPGNALARQFGLVFQVPEDLKGVYTAMKIDLPRYNGDDSWELAMTGRFIIDQAGVVQQADCHPDYTIRPDPEETLAALRGMRRDS